MKVDHTKIIIPLECNGQKYHITVQIENPGNANPVWMATGEEYKDPMQSRIGFGDSIEGAVIAFLAEHGKVIEFIELIDNYPQ